MTPEPAPETENDLLESKDAAAYLDVSRSTLCRLREIGSGYRHASAQGPDGREDPLGRNDDGGDGAGLFNLTVRLRKSVQAGCHRSVRYSRTARPSRTSSTVSA